MRLRKCAWNGDDPRVSEAGTNAGRPVWARRTVVSLNCPKSIITAASFGLLERFSYWKLAGSGSLMNEEAKTAEAILLLDEQWREEEKSGEIKK